MSSFEELRREIAERHQVIVGADDPILMLVTVNDYCVTRTLALLESAHAQALALQSQQLELAAKQWLAAAQTTSQSIFDRADKVIEAAATTAAASTHAAIAESTGTSMAALRIAIAGALCSSLLSLVACALLWFR